MFGHDAVDIARIANETGLMTSQRLLGPVGSAHATDGVSNEVYKAFESVPDCPAAVKRSGPMTERAAEFGLGGEMKQASRCMSVQQRRCRETFPTGHILHRILTPRPVCSCSGTLGLSNGLG
jgi:hypothetical protein